MTSSITSFHPGAVPISLCLSRVAGIRELIEQNTGWASSSTLRWIDFISGEKHKLNDAAEREREKIMVTLNHVRNVGNNMAFVKFLTSQ